MHSPQVESNASLRLPVGQTNSQVYQKRQVVNNRNIFVQENESNNRARNDNNRAPIMENEANNATSRGIPNRWLPYANPPHGSVANPPFEAATANIIGMVDKD